MRTNADTPEDARKAREFGAEGIGLCRTEHMFMAAERQEKMRAMIMAEEEDERRAALDELLPLQQEDFEGLFEEMAGLPVTIRLLDPPLHEFLPHEAEVAQEVERARIEVSDDLEELEKTLEAIHHLAETNPMLGTRGCRLAIIHPEIYEMQVRAIVRAALAVKERDRRRAAARDHDPAGRLREGARDHARPGGAHGRGGGRGGPRPDRRHDDRAAAGVLHGRPDRRASRTSSRSAPTT